MLNAFCPGLIRYVNEEGVVTEKGRVAANIQSADELVLTELIFSGGFKVTILL
jgi:ATP-dependent RNA helicase DOB1